MGQLSIGVAIYYCSKHRVAMLALCLLHLILASFPGGDEYMDNRDSFSRNDTESFARRVRKNLHFIMKERSEGEDVHEVTQLVISLLGIIVFPWEDGVRRKLEDLSLDELEQEGWPRWNITLDERGDTETLRTLIWHLRNAASHRRLTFSSDDREMDQVEIIFEDAPGGDARPNWRARINAAALRKFCDLFTKRIDNLVG